MKICWIYYLLIILHNIYVDCRDVEFYFSSVWRNEAVHHLFTNESSAVNGCYKSEDPKQLKHHNNPHDSVNQLTIVKQKAFMFVITNMQLFTLQYVIHLWNGVMDCLWIIVMFLSALLNLDNLDGTHSLPLVNTWCNAEFLQICFEEETNSSTSWMAWGWAHFQFRVNYSFKWIFYGPWENQSFCFVFTLTNYVHFIHIHED